MAPIGTGIVSVEEEEEEEAGAMLSRRSKPTSHLFGYGAGPALLVPGKSMVEYSNAMEPLLGTVTVS